MKTQKTLRSPLRRAVHDFRQLADSAPVMIWQAGADKLRTYFNKPWLDFVGRPMELEKGMGWADNIHPEDFTRYWEIYSQAFDTRQPFTAIYRLRRHDGEYHWVLSNCRPWFDARGTFRGQFGSCMDIHAQKQAEQEAYESQLALTHMRRVWTFGEMAASIAHELNQPLTAILTNAQAAQRIMDSPQPDYTSVKEIIADIISDDKRAGEVIRRLRNLLKKKPLELQPLQINGLIRDVAGMLRNDALLRQATLQLDLHENLPLTYGDDVQLQQVLLNLILNGFDAMNKTPVEKRVIVIRSSLEENHRVKVSVKDNGHGIGTHQLDRLFTPFFTTKSEGLGLGLAVTHSIIDGHKGKIWAENDADAGAIFHFSLPVHRAAVEEAVR